MGKEVGGRDSLLELALVVSTIARGRRMAEKAKEKQKRRGGL